jgi:periplasmic divalent cation tolerance protein
MSKYGIVLTTFENEQQAKPIIDEIIRCKLAACVQEIKIKSHYTWNGELCHEDEILVLIKTRKELYPELEKKLLELHPYETPEILFVDAENGSAAYLAWIDSQTKSDLI